MSISRSMLAAGACISLLAFAACGDDESETTAASETAASEPTVSFTEPAYG